MLFLSISLQTLKVFQPIFRKFFAVRNVRSFYCSSFRSDASEIIEKQAVQISQLGYINKFGENIDEEVKAALELLRTSENPTEADLISIQDRQLGHDLTNIFAVEKERCSYGFTRAFVLVPDLQSGMLRLSCPHLVKSLDRFEFELKGIETINATLSSAAMNKSESTLVKSEGQILRENFREINSAWKLIREKFLTETVVGKLYTFLGTTAADAFINSGIIGISPDKIDDVKCLHAHVADYLVRGDNLIGQWALKEMEEKYDVNPKGCKECWQQCDFNHARTPESWWYVPKKNKQKLRTKRQNRNLHKAIAAKKID